MIARMRRSVGVLFAGIAATLFACGLSITGVGETDPNPADATTAADVLIAESDANTTVNDGSAPSSDAGVTVDASVIAFVQQAQGNINAASLTVTIPATKAGDFIVVPLSSQSIVARISDDAPGGSNTYVSANLRSVITGCQASEIWYVRAAKAGATHVTTTLNASADLQVWVVEFSGLSPTGGVDQGAIDSGSATQTVFSPTVVPSNVPALIVSAIGSCNTVRGVHTSSPFTYLTAQSGNAAAYYIAQTPGSYGAVFDQTNASWNSSTASFR